MKRSKRPRIQPNTTKMIQKKTFEDFNQIMPNPEDPNQIENTPDSEESPKPDAVDEKRK